MGRHSLRVAGLAFAALFVATAVAMADDPRPQDEITAFDRRGVDAPAPPLAVHEWGVWRIRNGRVDHLAELARENPTFVHRTGRAAQWPLTPRRTPPELMIADKPVIFLHAGTTMDVELTVEFPGGEPWFHYPRAVAGITDPPAVRTLRWNGRAYAPNGAPQNLRFQRAVAGHWWSALRAANASTFVPQGSGEAERFLFYDGPVAFQRAWRTGQPTWTVANGRYTRRNARGVVEARGDMRALRADLLQNLRRQGLNQGESEALLRTWNRDLFTRPDARTLWFITRPQYDQMLPLTVVPQPYETVRVGLVIELP